MGDLAALGEVAAVGIGATRSTGRSLGLGWVRLVGKGKGTSGDMSARDDRASSRMIGNAELRARSTDYGAWGCGR